MSETKHKPDGGPGEPAVGFGPTRGGAFSQNGYDHPAAAWGAIGGGIMTRISQKTGVGASRWNE